MKVLGRARIQASLSAGLLGLGFLFPLVATALVTYSKIFLPRAGLRTFLFFAAVFAFLLAMLNAGKKVEADEANFFLYFSKILTGPGYFDFYQNVQNVTGKGEVAFYGMSYLLFGVLGTSFKTVTVFWTFFIYFISAFALGKMWKEKTEYAQAFPIFVLCVTFFINFALTAQTIKQYAAGAVVIASFALLSNNRKTSFLLMVTAGWIHNSALFFIVPWLTSIYLQTKINKLPSLFILLAMSAGLYVIGGMMGVLIENAPEDIQKMYFASLSQEDGEVTLLKIITIFTTLLILIDEFRARIERELLPFVVGFLFLVGLMLFFREVPLWLLRYSFYADFFMYILISMFLFNAIAKIKNESAIFLLITFPVIANVIVFARAYGSPWTYTWLIGDVQENSIFNLAHAMLAN